MEEEHCKLGRLKLGHVCRGAHLGACSLLLAVGMRRLQERVCQQLVTVPPLSRHSQCLLPPRKLVFGAT